MIRLVAALVCAATLASAPLAFAQDAPKKPTASKSTKASKATTKTCATKNNAGKAISWTCNLDQSCCFNPTLDKGVCGTPGLQCL